jgi:acid phosphatase
MNLIYRITTLVSLLSLFVIGPALGRALLLWWNKQQARPLPSQHLALAFSTMVSLSVLVGIYGLIWKANPRLVAWYGWLDGKIPISGNVEVSRGVEVTNEPLQVEVTNAAPGGYLAQSKLPRPDHVVLVVLENHSFDEIIDPKNAPFISGLATDGALFVNSFAVSHPSEPNYFALFSGSTQGVHDNGNYTFDRPTLAGALRMAGKSFVGYVETDSPREHNPWESFPPVRDTEHNLAEFPTDLTQLPTVSFVIPNNKNDMHDGSIQEGDTWLKAHLSAYANWAKAHNSLLIVTFDEDDESAGNHIPTIVYGAHVRPGRYSEHISHYNVLSTILAMYELPSLARTSASPPIRTIWD